MVTGIGPSEARARRSGEIWRSTSGRSRGRSIRCRATCRPRAPTGGGGSNVGRRALRAGRAWSPSSSSSPRSSSWPSASTAFGGDDDADGGDRPAPEPGHRRADAADDRDRRAARTGAPPAPDLAEPPDGDRLPLGRRRRALPPSGRPPGERGRRAADRARHLRRRRRLAEVVPARRRRHVGARRRRADRQRRLLAGGRDGRRHPAVHRRGEDVRLRDRHPAADRSVASSSR